MSTAKEELTRLIEEQPEDSSPEEIVRELAFHVMVERGLADSDAKRVISNDEMARRIRTWRNLDR
ncbi:MAG: hypothetical protein ACT4O5_09640 [Gammaproteobacteria bacterium]